VAAAGAAAEAAVAAAAADAVASSLEAASAALPVAAARAAPRPVGYGRQVGDGSIAVHRRLSSHRGRLSSHRRRLSHYQPNRINFLQQLRQLRDVRRDPPRLTCKLGPSRTFQSESI
jgi:hypothetical protein